MVYLSRRQEFRGNLKGKQAIDIVLSCSTKKLHLVFDPNFFCWHEKKLSGKYGPKIRDPFLQKNVWLGSFPTVEEALKAYLIRKQEILEKLNEIQSSHSVLIAESIARENYMLPDKADNLGFLNGVQVINANSMFVGGFCLT